MILPIPSPHPVAPPVELPTDHFRLQTSAIAGYFYRAEAAWLPLMKIGEKLELIPEPANPYDRYAVRVHWQDKHIGYLPRRSNHIVSRLLRQGAPLTAVIAWLDPSETHQPPLTLHVLFPKQAT